MKRKEKAERERTEQLRPILDELDAWRYESLHARFIIGYAA